MNLIFTIKSMDTAIIKELQTHLYSEWAWSCLNDDYPGNLVMQYLESKEGETVIKLNGTEKVISFAEENISCLLIKENIDFIRCEDAVSPSKVIDTVIFKR